MKTIEHVTGARQKRGYGGHVSRRHVRGHRFDLRARRAHALPKGRQRVAPFAFADMDHRTAFQVQNHRQVAMSLTDGDFVDRDPPQVLELGPAEPPLQVLLLDLLDAVSYTHL